MRLQPVGPAAICVMALSLMTLSSAKATTQPAPADDPTTVGAPAAADSASKPASQPTSAPSAENSKLIEQLGHEKWAVREEADRKLRQSRDPAVVPALRKAAESADPETELRAKLILASLLNFSHVVVDAQGAPIADATITVTYADHRTPTVLKTNRFGGVTLPQRANMSGTLVRFSHPDFGTTQGHPPHMPAPSPEAPPVAVEIRVPLVHKDSPAYARALKATVQGPDDKAVEGVQVSCNEVRTPGMGLIQYHNNLPAVLTDKKGQFSLYLPDLTPRNERGTLIPPNSRYTIAITSADGSLFPYQGVHDNTQQATIKLLRPELFHRFEFEAADGGRVTGNKLTYVGVAYQPAGGAGVSLGQKYVRDGGKLLPGRYVAYMLNEQYVPLEVTKDSPETLLFRLPAPVTFRGRVIDGATDKPLAGAFVFGFSGKGSDELAMLTDREWKDLESLPAKPSSNATELKCFTNKHEVLAIVRTDADGKYEIAQPADKKFYALMALARNRLPFERRTYLLSADAGNVASAGDMPLFPAAKVIARITAKQQLWVMPEWVIARTGQPKWVDKLLAVEGMRDAEIEYGDWLTLNAAQPIYVPADVQLTLRFRAPNNDEVCTASYDKPIRLAAGESLDIGEVTFAPALKVQVRVVDKAGRGIEGVPVRQLRKDTNSWTVAHNTDEHGLAHFYAQPNAKGHFAITDLLHASNINRDNMPQVKADVGDKAPDKPFVITVPDDQIKALVGAGTPVKTHPPATSAPATKAATK